MTKNHKDYYVEYLSDPNPRGAFVGGPPLLSTEETLRLMESTDYDERARRALEKLREEYEDQLKAAVDGVS